jgi:hypothetical protein
MIDLIERSGVRGAMVSDAYLAALANRAWLRARHHRAISPDSPAFDGAILSPPGARSNAPDFASMG